MPATLVTGRRSAWPPSHPRRPAPSRGQRCFSIAPRPAEPTELARQRRRPAL